MKLAAENLTFSYGSRKITDLLDIEIEPGRLTFLLGANGCGKSTLVKLLSGLLEPSGGRITLDGVDLKKISMNSRARHIGVMLQQGFPALDFTAEEFVLLGRNSKLPRLSAPGEADIKAVRHALELLRMASFADKAANRLSGGEFQRLCLASVLSLESEILLLDEPVSAQDPAQSALIFEALRKLSKEKSILVISHGLDLASCYAERLLLLAGGRIFADGTPQEILTGENLEKLYGLPGFSAFPAGTFRFQPSP